MSFDPEKVERINSFDYMMSEHRSYVDASDYDQLLELYRAERFRYLDSFHPLCRP
jgi:hypothetical protein